MISNIDYIEVIINNEIRFSAYAKLDKFDFTREKRLHKFGSEKGRALAGFMGEKMSRWYFGLPLEDGSDNEDFDFIYRNKKYEVKTISAKFCPSVSYWVTVNSSDLSGARRQRADYYLFNRVRVDFSVGWILGYIGCDEFFDKGEFKKKGSRLCDEVEFLKANGTVLAIRELRPISQIVSPIDPVVESMGAAGPKQMELFE